MKANTAMSFAPLAMMLLLVGSELAAGLEVRTQDKTITKVVKLLQAMLEKSQAEGDEERKIYAKFKCYCDTSTADKTKAIADNTKLISILESEIEELQGSNGELSSQCADLKTKMADNEAKRSEARGIRSKQNTEYRNNRADFEQAIKQMNNAVATLTKVGADQTASTGADNKQFMAGHNVSLLSLQSSMQTALSAAEAFMDEKQYKHVASFLQGPFTGTYTSQSGQVMGIIKNMRDTFKANLATAIADEKSQLASHNEFMKVKTDAFNDMSRLYDESQTHLGDNDNDLSNKRSQLNQATKAKTDDEAFMSSLRPMCKDKAKSYEERKVMRANEEVAVSEAISILNSDSAFATFDTVTATSKQATFLQVAKKHFPGVSDEDVRQVVQRLLHRAAGGRSTPRIAKVISTLQAENPFDTVLSEITKMIKVIDDESASDKEKLDWCKQERTDNRKSRKQKNSELLNLEGKIDQLTKDIDAPQNGFKAQIEATEVSLENNKQSQTTETADRAEANVAYQADIKNLVAADQLIDNAIKVLKAFYDNMTGALLQSEVSEEPAPPSTWGSNSASSYSGQSTQGNSAITMLQHILTETRREEKAAHTEEETAQASYEDSMTELKRLQAKKEKSLGELQSKLANAEEDLLEAQEDHKATTADRDGVQDYLDKIRPGCDFITTNFNTRVSNRRTEKNALNQAKTTLKGSAAYRNAVTAATEEGYGACKKVCVADVNHVNCKACLADVTKPAYCAGHKGTAGC